MRSFIALTLTLAVTSSATAADWGHLQMRFVYDGEPPAPKVNDGGPLGPIKDESLLVNLRNRGLQHICVWLLPADDEQLPVHPENDQSPAELSVMRIQGGNFAPRITLLRTAQSLAFINADSHGYNIKAELLHNEPFNRLLDAGNSIACKFVQPEQAPALVCCSIHPWPHGYILIRGNPYFALSDKDGQLIIKNLPTGIRTFVLWHEKAGFIKQAIRNEKPADLDRGRFILEIQPGDNDRGEIKLSPEQFKQ